MSYSLFLCQIGFPFWLAHHAGFIFAKLSCRILISSLSPTRYFFLGQATSPDRLTTLHSRTKQIRRGLSLSPREKEKQREPERESAEINKLRGRAPLCQGEKEGKLRAGDKGSGTHGGKAERYNVMNLFMQYNLAHSDYNSAKFNWIVYPLRLRYGQSKREPRTACSYFASFSPIPVFSSPRNKRGFIEFPRKSRERLLNQA